MRRITNAIINSLIWLIEILSSLMNFKIRARIASLFGNFIYYIATNRRRITIENLEKAFPGQNNKWLVSVARKSFCNIAITFFELLAQRKYKLQNVIEQIQYENIELIHKSLDHGNGVILMSGHFGNWELLALSAGIFSGKPILVVVQRQKYWDKQIGESRTKFGNSIVERGSAARKLVSSIRNNEAVALLADQSPPMKDGILVEFFGRKTLTYKAPAELALKFRTPIVAGFAVRNSDYTYTVRLEEIQQNDLEFTGEGIKNLTQRYTNFLEKNIRENPHLWSWPHRRWKNSPEINENNV